MKYSKRAELFRQVKADYIDFLASVLWKLTGDRELFTEAMQNSLLGMWRNVEKLNGPKAGAYIYRIALTANSKAWRERIGRNGEFSEAQVSVDEGPDEKVSRNELVAKIRRAVAQLPAKQSKAIVMRYFEQQGYEAVAEKLNCSEAGARSHVAKAVATLKSKLATLRD